MPRLPVLVVEDNATERYALEHLLAQFDYTTVTLSSGEEAIEYLKTSKVAAILMDLSLPGIDGFQCAERIRSLSQHKDVPIIALTGRTDQHSQDAATKVGMTAYLSKPFDIEELRKILLRHVYDPDMPNLKTLTPMDSEEN